MQTRELSFRDINNIYEPYGLITFYFEYFAYLI